MEATHETMIRMNVGNCLQFHIHHKNVGVSIIIDSHEIWTYYIQSDALFLCVCLTDSCNFLFINTHHSTCDEFWISNKCCDSWIIIAIFRSEKRERETERKICTIFLCALWMNYDVMTFRNAGDVVELKKSKPNFIMFKVKFGAKKKATEKPELHL